MIDILDGDTWEEGVSLYDILFLLVAFLGNRYANKY